MDKENKQLTETRNCFAVAAHNATVEQELKCESCTVDAPLCKSNTCSKQKSLNNIKDGDDQYTIDGAVFCNLSHPDECTCVGVWYL